MAARRSWQGAIDASPNRRRGEQRRDLRDRTFHRWQPPSGMRCSGSISTARLTSPVRRCLTSARRSTAESSYHLRQGLYGTSARPSMARRSSDSGARGHLALEGRSRTSSRIAVSPLAPTVLSSTSSTTLSRLIRVGTRGVPRERRVHHHGRVLDAAAGATARSLRGIRGVEFDAVPASPRWRAAGTIDGHAGREVGRHRDPPGRL